MWNALAGSRYDVRQAMRGLARSPGHCVAVVSCLGIGMIVSVVAFSLINALAYGELPGIADRGRLTQLFIQYAGEPYTSFAVSDFESIEADPGPSVTGLAAEGRLPIAVGLDDQNVATNAAFVSGAYFETLGTRPMLGRLLMADDRRADSPLVAVIGYHLWRERFEARPDIVGQPLDVGGQIATVVGVAPPRFIGSRVADIGTAPMQYAQVWLPLQHARRFRAAPSVDTPWLRVVGRLSAGATLERLRDDSRIPAGRLAAARPDTRRDAQIVVRRNGVGPSGNPAEMLVIVALFLSVPLSVLAIGCANSANLQLGRAWSRHRELATRLALGASRGQVVRVLVFEALALAAIAAAIGWLGAREALTYVQPYFPLTIAIDVRVFGFALLLTAGATLLGGVWPAWLSARRVSVSSLKQAGPGGGLAHARLRGTLVVAQIALSLTLLIMSGLFVRSVQAQAGEVPHALKAIAAAPLDLRQIDGTPEAARTLYDTLQARLTADVRVRRVAFEHLEGFRLRRADDPSAREQTVTGGSVTPDWFETMGARLVAGRLFTLRDRASGGAVINERLARELAGASAGAGGGAAADAATATAVAAVAIGQTVSVRDGERAPQTVRIIGVIAGIRNSPSDRDTNRALYLPMADPPPTNVTLLVRTPDAIDPVTIMPEIRRLVSAIEPRLPIGVMQTAEAIYLHDAGEVLYMALTVGSFGAIAMLLAASGLLAVVGYSVSLRTREIGIRMAIGARPGDVTRLILRESTLLAMAGIITGLLLALPLALSLRAVFDGVSPVDPIALATPCLTLLLVSLIAAGLPAHRAARIDPATTLRDG